MHAPHKHKEIPNPSWEGVRTIYKKLSEEFHVLTSSFDISIDPDTMIYLDHLIIAIDEIDTCIDALSTKEERDSITDAMLTFLSDNTLEWSHPNETKTLAANICNLKQVLNLLNIDSQVIGAATSIFHYTEIKRHTTDQALLIDYVTLEGAATALLPLSIMGVDVESPFGEFFTNLCKLMGVADLVIDAREDYKLGYIALKPSLTLYTTLISIVFSNGLRLLTSIPHKGRFIRYCLRFGIALLRG